MQQCNLKGMVSTNFKQKALWRSKNISQIKQEECGYCVICQSCSEMSKFELSKTIAECNGCYLLYMDEQQFDFESVKTQFQQYILDKNIVETQFIVFNTYGDMVSAKLELD